MSEFEPLSVKLKPHLHKPFAHVPKDLQKSVKRLFLIPWDRYTPRERAQLVFWHDLQNDPSTSRKSLARFEQLSTEAYEIECKLRSDAITRWKLNQPAENIFARDLEMDQRAFRVWFYQWWRTHDRTAPSREQAYQEFSKARRISWRRSNQLLMQMRPDLRQKRGQPGVSKRSK